MRIFHNPNFNFVKWRWHALALSAIVIGAGIFTIVTRGLPLGVDFSGGTMLTFKFDQAVDEETVRRALPDFGDAIVQTTGAPAEHRILVRLPMVRQSEEAHDIESEARSVEAALRAANVGNFIMEGKEIVGPVMGEDLRNKGLWATLASLAGITAYIWFRFRFTFAIGALAATIHDVLLTLAFLVWFGYDLTLNVIAALLTVTGYSFNDTIVIFDRVRENQRTAKRESLEDVVNRSVNQTLSRTIITSGVTCLAVVSLYVLGGEVLRGLAFTLLVGIIAGTYSTVFIASSIAILLSRKTPSGPAAAQSAPRARRA
ncbi:MAG TPA: protein translocase subunit SecF [Vicinamibacterales bacterium]|nr:protein translocase subunit SecF [Vicinamibacterales bacterium]